jgi:Site-specific recombinase XerD
LVEYLKKRDITSGQIFISVHGKPITVRYLQIIINERAERLLPRGTKVSAHMLRHHFATSLLRKGMKMPTLQKILGHSSIMTTMNYLHLSDKETQKEFKDVEKVINF